MTIEVAWSRRRANFSKESGGEQNTEELEQ